MEAGSQSGELANSDVHGNAQEEYATRRKKKKYMCNQTRRMAIAN